MYWLSDKFIWIPLYLLFVYLMIRSYRWRAVIVLLFAGALVTMSDQISVHFFKEVFERLRPCHDPEIGHLVHLVKDKCGGRYSFVSSHATNHFAIAVFLALVLGKKYRFFTPLILFWAAIVAYSRVYLGVHYPADIVVGALVGAILGWVMGRLCLVILTGSAPHPLAPSPQGEGEKGARGLRG